MRNQRRIIQVIGWGLVLLTLVLYRPASAQNIDTKKLLEDFSLQLFENNAPGFMGPLVIVTNVGANDGFFSSAAIPRTRGTRVDRLDFTFSVRSMMAWVRDDQRSYTGWLPLSPKAGDDDQLQLFKSLLRGAVEADELDPTVTSATVFGSQGGFIRIPKSYIKRAIPFIPDSVLTRLPDSLALTNGTNQNMVIAAVPQLQIGTFLNSQVLLRYIPPVRFDTAVGDFSFFGIALRHSISNWFQHFPVDVAVQASYQHSTIDNVVGATRAILQATTEMYSFNIHASKAFQLSRTVSFEPFLGFSFERLESTGSYTFTLPKSVVDQIGYDISPQKALIALDDNAIKATIGTTWHFGPAELALNVGISKHLLFGAGLGIHWGWDL